MTTSLRDRGFRRIDQEATGIIDPLDAQDIPSIFRGRANYEIEQENTRTWMRDAARDRGSNYEPMTKEIACWESAPNQADVQSTLQEYFSSGYASISGSGSNVPYGQIQSMFQDSLGLDDPQRWEQWGRQIVFCPSESLSDFLSNHLIPDFFNRYANGAILVFLSNDEYETRYSLVRGGYTIRQYGRPIIQDIQDAGGGFDALKDYHSFDTVRSFRISMMLASMLYFPWVPTFVTGPLGLTFCFILDPPEEFELRFPMSWISFPQSRWDFAEYPNIDLSNQLAAHRRLIQADPPSKDEVLQFIRWTVYRNNELAYHQSDPCEFTCPDDPDKIDFVTTYEHAITLERILRKAISCMASSENIVRKEAAMEVADLLETLREKVWNVPSRGRSFFHELFHPVNGRDLLKACLLSLPEPAKTRFVESCERCYQELQDKVIESIWVPGKIRGNQVLVKNRRLTSENEEDAADFVSSLVRSLRNAHHGYITRADSAGRNPAHRPSRYLVMTRGALPDTFSYLGCLFGIALLSNPKEIIGWEWMAVGAYD